jgi:hypothetical protein
MTMQYDVLAKHAHASGTQVSFATRLKNFTVTSGTSSLRNAAICDPTVFKSGTYDRPAADTTVTVTITAHGLITGDRVFMDFTTGTAVDGVYEVAVTNANVFTVTTAASTATSGAITFYSSILLELDTYNIIGLPVLIPGEGIYCKNGMFVGVGGSVTATVFYG